MAAHQTPHPISIGLWKANCNMKESFFFGWGLVIFYKVLL
jgi:hypothetical protein